MAANDFYLAMQIHDPAHPDAGKWEVVNAATNERGAGTDAYADAGTAASKAEELNGAAFMARAAAANAMARRA